MTRRRDRAARTAARGAAVLALLLAGAWHARADGGGAHPSGPTGALPGDVARLAADAAARAAEAPGTTLELARAADAATRDAPLVAWDLDADWDASWDGTHAVRASVAARVPILDPAAERDHGEARDLADATRLDASLAVREAHLAAVRGRIALWRLRAQVDLLASVRALPRPRDPDAAARYDDLLSAEPSLARDADGLARRLARSAGWPAVPPLPLDAWDAYVLGATVAGCPDRDPNVLRAAAHLRTTRARADRERSYRTRPSVAVAVSGSVSVADIGASPLGGRVSLSVTVGAPPGWAVAGSLRGAAHPTGASLGVSLRSDADAAPTRWDLEVARARRALDDARFGAALDVADDLAAFRSVAAELRAAPAPDRPPSDLGAAEAAGRRLARVAHGADLRARLDAGCGTLAGLPSAPWSARSPSGPAPRR